MPAAPSSVLETMRTHRTRKLLSVALTLALLGVAWHYFAPSAVGGTTTYVVTDGISMQPRFHSGDLALVHSEPNYRVGQIVAYHSHLLHTVVLHRIIAIEGERYVFKGDNNHFIDFEHPRRSQLIGSLWLHVPGAGADLRSLRSPFLIAGLIFVGALLLMGAAFVNRRRRRGRRRRAEAPAHRPALARPSLQAGGATPLALAALILLVPVLTLALLAFTRPARTSQHARIHYVQRGVLSYSASAPAGPTYPSGSVHTGEPLFTHVLSTVAFHYRYAFHTNAAHRVAGRASLQALLISTNGWQTTLPLSAAQPFRGDTVTVEGTLDLGAVNSLVHRVETTTSTTGTTTLTVIAHVQTRGSIGSVPVHAAFAASVPFQLGAGELRTTPAAGTPAPSTTTPPPSLYEHQVSGSAAGSRYQAAKLTLGPLSLPVSLARWIALGGILLLAAGIAFALTRMRPRRRTESESIRARFGYLIVPVARVWQQPGVPVIDVQDIDSLVRIAEHYERSILYELAEYGDAYWVTDESGQFRYVADLNFGPAVEQPTIEQPVPAVAAAAEQLPTFEPAPEPPEEVYDAEAAARYGYEPAAGEQLPAQAPYGEPHGYDAPAPQQPLPTYEPAAAVHYGYEPAPAEQLPAHAPAAVRTLRIRARARAADRGTAADTRRTVRARNRAPAADHPPGAGSRRTLRIRARARAADRGTAADTRRTVRARNRAPAADHPPGADTRRTLRSRDRTPAAAGGRPRRGARRARAAARLRDAAGLRAAAGAAPRARPRGPAQHLACARDLRRPPGAGLRAATAAGASHLRPPAGRHTEAERAGFEPAMEFEPHTRLAGECLQPLGHLSRGSCQCREWRRRARGGSSRRARGHARPPRAGAGGPAPRGRPRTRLRPAAPRRA